jgi:cytochrome subunit of sulfide dehydrogenase
MMRRGGAPVRLISLAGAGMVSLAVPGLAAPAVPPPGASSCSGCHALAATVTTAIPSPQNLTAAEIEAAMLAFKSGERQATVMNRIARGFSDQEIGQIAAWLGQGG